MDYVPGRRRACHFRNFGVLALLPALAVGCGDDSQEEEVQILPRASQSGTIDVSADDSLVAMVNPEAGSVSIFQAADNTLLARVATGASPSAVAFHPDGTTLFVANRADASVVRVSNANTANPTVGTPLAVGSEPTGLALSPSGARLFVAEFAEGRVAVVDTASMTVTSTIDGPEHPYALAVTNDLNNDDNDELLIVPEFFGEPIGDEATDTSRQGRVRVYQLSDLAATTPIVFAPVASGFAPAAGGDATMTSPNQLHSVAINAGRIYVTSISASPAPPVSFNTNVQPVVYVADLATRTPVSDGSGTVNLAAAVRDAAAGATFQFLADTVDISFAGADSGIGYALSRGADTVQRVVFGADDTTVGSTANLQIDVLPAPAGASAGCQGPSGIRTAHNAPRAYVNCWVNRQLAVIDLASQNTVATVESSLSTATADVDRGRRFFFTGRARWSDNGWSSCGSCHPGGLTDNITWSFAAGPRQTTSLDGSFSHGAGEQKQRIFNWTGIFDEIHDFERNTRGVSGGLGAVVQAAEGSDCSNTQERINIDPVAGSFLLKPVKEFQDAAESCVTDDWDAIEAWVKTINPPRGLQSLDAASVARGAALFGMPDTSNNNGGCVACHGGQGWTVSRRFWTPSEANNTALTSEPFVEPDEGSTAWVDAWNDHTVQIAPQPSPAAGPAQVACVIRNVGTFGSTSLEKRANGMPAQGEGGYNVPSLYGLSLGAPFLHHGQAADLEELLTSSDFQEHLQAGNQVFLTTASADQDRADLTAFLLSIDASTAEQSVPAELDVCPTSFEAP